MPRGLQKSPTKKELIAQIESTPSLHTLLPIPFRPQKMRVADLRAILASHGPTQTHGPTAGSASGALALDSGSPLSSEMSDSPERPIPPSNQPSPRRSIPPFQPSPGRSIPTRQPSPEWSVPSRQPSLECSVSPHSGRNVPPPPPQSSPEWSSASLQQHSATTPTLPVPSTPTTQALKLYIDDLRMSPLSSHRKRTLTIHVQGTTEGIVGIENGVPTAAHITICTLDILRAVQSSASPIVGDNAVQVGFADEYLCDYTEVFVTAKPAELTSTEHQPDQIQLPLRDGSPLVLSLRVDNVVPHSLDSTHADVQAGPSSNHTGQPASLVEWLTIRAAETEGYQDFANGRNRLLQNSQIAANWAFVANFAEKYYRKPHSFGVKPIRKCDIYAALGIKETSLTQAEEAHRIIRKFGENGSSPADPVMSKLNEEHSSPEGAVKLLHFLKEWDRDLAHHADM